MKIVFIGGQEMPGIGGAETYMMCLAQELYTQGHETTIICSGRKAHECTIDNVKIIHKVCPKSNIIALPLLFLKSIGYIIRNRKNIDVVNYQSIFLAFLPGWIARLAHCKVCYTIHSLAEDNPKHNAIMKFIMKLVAFISIWLCGKNIVTVSHSKALEIKERYGKKCAVIPCGININDSAAETDILERYGIKKGNYYLSIGRIDPIKNLDILVKSFIKHNSNDKQLVIAGNYDTEYGRTLMELAAGNKNIIFTNIVMGADKTTLLKNSYAGCLVSSSEGMPIFLLESVIYSKPVIVTNIPAIREIIHKGLGYWCNVGDVDTLHSQMQILEKEYETAIGKAAKSKKYIEEMFIWDKVAKKYIEYLNLI